MEETASTLTVLFEDPFWVGIYERESDERYQVCKIIFGAEPQSAQVYQYLLQNWQRLRFSPALGIPTTAAATRPNPKRVQRDINKQLQQRGIGTKAQQALKLQQEQGKQGTAATLPRTAEAVNNASSLLNSKNANKNTGALARWAMIASLYLCI